ncbi:hypothetical protein QAD02_019746 [Eretmocerus hayati]|uniref:Uncharacterized protein n=1 Tax=Eretmocerus hayati TaxID=131215 RepID=A0ACC2PKZ3_9HYME|nr:hypothetical protein QAD02_019746 [Eretmocerus hayati]
MSAILLLEVDDQLTLVSILFQKDISLDAVDIDFMHPHIVVIGGKSDDEDSSFWDHTKNDNLKEYYLLIDKFAIECASDIMEALQLLLGSYYVFNRSYPIEATCFLEFLQQQYLEIVPGSDSRSRRISVFQGPIIKETM